MDNFNIENFELYVTNAMSADEKMVFEQKIFDDPQFAADFEHFKTLKAGIRKQALQDRLDILKKNIDHKPSEAPEPLRHSWASYLLYLLGLAILMALIFYLVRSPEKPETQPSLPAVHTQKQDSLQQQDLDSLRSDTMRFIPQKTVVPAVKGKTSVSKQDKGYADNEFTPKNQWREAMALYSKPQNLASIMRDGPSESDKKFNDAILLFKASKYKEVTALIGNEKDEKNLYLNAHALLLTGKTQQATVIFRNFADDDFSTYHEESRWYLALALFANYPETKDELNSLTAQLLTVPDYKQKVADLIAKMK